MKRRNFIYIPFLAVVLFFVANWLIIILRGEVPHIDRWMQNIASLYTDTFIYTFSRWMTELGTGDFLIPLGIIMFFVIWWMLRDWFAGAVFGIGVLGTHMFHLTIKALVERERPTISIILDAQGYSYPSGHAMVSIVLYGLIAFFIAKKFTSVKAKFIVQLLFAMLVFFIGISRPLLDVHYLTDVITGYVLGYFCLIATIWIYEYIRDKRRD